MSVLNFVLRETKFPFFQVSDSDGPVPDLSWMDAIPEEVRQCPDALATCERRTLFGLGSVEEYACCANQVFGIKKQLKKLVYFL